MRDTGALLRTALRFVTLAWVLPVVLSYMAYFGYCSNISGDVFSESGFHAIYDTGVFRYRVLGQMLLHTTYDLIGALGVAVHAPEVLQKASPTLDPRFYYAFYCLNTFTLCLTASVLFALTGRLRKNQLVTDLTMLVAVGLMVFAEYVVVPYDVLSCLFLLAAIYLIQWGPREPLRIALLCAIVLLATLTRETAVLVLAYYGAFHFDDLFGKAPRQDRATVWFRLALMALTFVVAYVGLRWAVGGSGTAFQKIRFKQNLKQPFSRVGAVFFAATVGLSLLYAPTRRKVFLFVALSTPYWLAMFVIANPREIRLWVPMVLALLVMRLEGEADAAPVTSAVRAAPLPTPPGLVTSPVVGAEPEG